MKRACAPTEEQRFESRAQRLLIDEVLLGPGGSREIPLLLRNPYLEYEANARTLCTAGRKILELGAGTGLHSIALASNGADLTCIDIAKSALECLNRRLTAVGLRATSVVGTMERLPFEPESFDVIACAGSLSYGDPSVVDREILRVLKKGGSLLFVDSLNHNPIYRLNRWAHWRIRGDRTRSTLRRMPTLARMQQLGKRFESWSLRGFGAWSWLWSPIAGFVGESTAARCNDACDRLPASRWLAFKFVFEAHGLREQ